MKKLQCQTLTLTFNQPKFATTIIPGLAEEERGLFRLFGEARPFPQVLPAHLRQPIRPVRRVNHHHRLAHPLLHLVAPTSPPKSGFVIFIKFKKLFLLCSRHHSADNFFLFHSQCQNSLSPVRLSYRHHYRLFVLGVFFRRSGLLRVYQQWNNFHHYRHFHRLNSLADNSNNSFSLRTKDITVNWSTAA